MKIISLFGKCFLFGLECHESSNAVDVTFCRVLFSNALTCCLDIKGTIQVICAVKYYHEDGNVCVCVCVQPRVKDSHFIYKYCQKMKEGNTELSQGIQVE
jgi:hypothetical protein